MAFCSMRIIAVICILLAALPMLTLMPTSLLLSYIEIKSSVVDLYEYPDDTTGFKQDRYHTIVKSSATLFLDFLACISAWGLVAIIFNVISPPRQVIFWITSVIAGFGTALLDFSYVAPSTDRHFIILVVIIPIIVGAASFLGAIFATINLMNSRKSIP